MSKSGTGAGTPSERPFRSRPREHDGSLPADMTAAGLKPLLISERSAAWLPWSPLQVPADEPEIDGACSAGVEWTPDLVHCRLVEAGNVLKRLPDITWPTAYGTVWRQLAPKAGSVAAPARYEIDLCWWTVDQLLPLPLTRKVITTCFMLELSVRDVEEVLKRRSSWGVAAMSKSGVHRAYMLVRQSFAREWSAASVRVDRGSYERWRHVMDRRPK